MIAGVLLVVVSEPTSMAMPSKSPRILDDGATGSVLLVETSGGEYSETGFALEPSEAVTGLSSTLWGPPPPSSATTTGTADALKVVAVGVKLKEFSLS